MTQLTWNKAGERTFESGVDRGVLYVDGVGVVWNGLISVSENPSGGEVTPYYIDGIKYLDHVASEDFQATIEAFTYPDEFAECDGTIEVSNGLFATKQRKKSFGLAYQTKVGNDIDGVEHAYKIHLVYNAIAVPTERVLNTLAQEVDLSTFSWEIHTKPDNFIGYKPTSYFVIDSRDVPEILMDQILDILYGTSEIDPRLPSTTELLFIFSQFDPSIFDAGFLTEEYFMTIDAGHISITQTSTVDGGGP